jgi:cytochrome c-type biogenesis protein
MDFSLIIPAFIAGILTFLAPCTLPLVPGYLGFVSGVSVDDLKDPEKARSARWKIFKNGLLYVIGFSLVFIALGSLFGVAGAALAHYRIWLSRIGGIFVILFGLFMTGIINLNFLKTEKQFRAVGWLKPGRPSSSFILGTTFAFGWTPCVGPILGSVLLLASTTATVGQGALLLTVFAAGLAIPFLAIAIGIGWATKHLKQITKHLEKVSIIGGIFLVFIGILLLTNKLGVWIGFFFQLLNFINYESLLDHL